MRSVLRPTPYVAGMYYIPNDTLSREDKLSLKVQLTAKSYSLKDPVPKIVECFDTSVRGFFGVPRAYAEKHFDISAARIRVVNPSPEAYRLRYRSVVGAITPRDDEQRRFMDSLLAACRANPGMPVQILANADTGTGKTVTALRTCVELGIPALVTVPRERLLHQWLGSVEEKNGMRYFFGNDWVRKNVGIIRQDKCIYKNKLICIAMAPSLARRQYPDAFYEYFGIVIHDEVHTLAAPVASAVFQQFPARILVGLTATNRRDDLAKVCDLFLGKPKVISKQRALAPTVYQCPRTVYRDKPFYSDASAKTWLCLDPVRNKYLANLIYNRGYKRGRNVLVLSDSVKQLQTLYNMFLSIGIPAHELGLYVGEKYRMHKGKFLSKKEKVSDEEYERIAAEAKIIFATYGIFATGTDIKRLDMGVEAYPRSDLVQAIGRITRVLAGKPDPEWYTLIDTVYVPSPLAGHVLYPAWVNQAKRRIASYRQHNARIVTVGKKS